MEIIGFLALLVLGVWLSLFAFFVMLNCSGLYNIGGCVNSIWERLLAWMYMLGVLVYWYFLFFEWSPFKLVVY